MIKNRMATLALALVAAQAHADGDYLSPTDERVRVSLGVMRVSSATALRVDSRTGVAGTNLSGENDFGLSKSDFEPKFQALVRVADRHRLRFDYFTLDRTGSKTLTAPIVFRDIALQTLDPVRTNLSLRTLGITYGYSFWHSERLEIAGTFGVNVTEISARARVQTQTRHVDQREDQAGPFPTLGLDATWVLSKRFYIDGRFQYLKVSINHLDGSLGFYELAALYRLRPNVSLALGYTKVRAHLASTQAAQSGLFDFSAQGPELFVRVAF